MLKEKFLACLKQPPPWAILILCIIFSEIFTLALNIIQSIIWFGEISVDLLYIGTIDAFIVSFIIGGAIVFFLSKIKKEQTLNQLLQQEIAFRQESDEFRMEVELKAFQQSKLASLGEIATGIAHEINQPLTYIKIMLESQLRDLQNKQLNPDETAEDTRESLKQIKRITTIIDHLRAFGRDQSLEIEEIDLNEVLQNSLILFGQRLKLQNIQFSQDIHNPLPIILGNKIKLEQVLINLFQNSIDALQGKKDKQISISLYHQDKKVIIDVTDNGGGIPIEIQDKIFEPFFTTKNTGEGTGIGLAIAFGIIKEHNGSIEYVNTPGSSCFQVILPVLSATEPT